jgi:energy-converting hydrogenase Eha subunit H
MAAVDQFTGQRLSVHAFSYPPTALLFLWPLGFLAYLPALIVFLGLTGAAFLWAARPWIARAGLPWWSAALVPASLINIWAGHYGFLFSALWLGAFAAMEAKPRTAGGLIALLTFKPHMGIVIPPLLLLRRQGTVIVTAALGTIALIAASLILFGGAAWLNYLTGTSSLQAHLLVKQQAFFFKMMPTAYASVWSTTGLFPLAVAAQCASAIAALYLLARAARGGLAWRELGLMAATATFLVLPYAFNYDMPVVGLAAAMLLFGRDRLIDPVDRALALLALGTPVLVLTAGPAAPFLPLALLGFLWVQARAYGALANSRLKPALAA